jgi:DNA-directed RNA polymerase specialized sigma24 family protein
MKEDAGTLSRVEDKLDTLIRLFALSIIDGVEHTKEKAVLLSKAGLPPKEIAALCDTTPHTISVQLSAARRDGKA